MNKQSRHWQQQQTALVRKCGLYKLHQDLLILALDFINLKYLQHNLSPQDYLIMKFLF